MESGGSRIIQGQYCPLLVLILFGDFSGMDITHFRFNTGSGWNKPELSTTAACCLKQAIILNMMCQQAVRARSVNNTIRQGYQLSPVDLPLHAVTLLYNTHVWYLSFGWVYWVSHDEMMDLCTLNKLRCTEDDSQMRWDWCCLYSVWIKNTFFLLKSCLFFSHLSGMLVLLIFF